jgi:hypothetical protein
MRRPAVIVVMVLAAIGTAVAATRALHRAASNLVGTKLGIYDTIFVIGRDLARQKQKPLVSGAISMGRAGIEPATLGLRGPCSAG